MVTLSLLAACLMLPASRINAQSGSGNVTINITLRPVQTISITPGQHTTDILYASVSDYQSGVSVTRDDHLTVFSTGGFLVSVETSNENFTRVGGTETIPVSDVAIRAVKGTGNETDSEFFDVTLSTTSTPLITSDNGGRNLKYGITYDNSLKGAANHYINRYVSGDGAETVYRSQVTYTITTR